jgi:proteic killer suppression protein
MGLVGGIPVPLQNRAIPVFVGPGFGVNYLLTIISLSDNILNVIESFASKETEKIFLGEVSKKFPPDIQRTARRKLLYLDDAVDLQDIQAVPGNRLEKLKGDRANQHSIRINDQWRICFEWVSNNARNVEIVDYHS